MPWSMWPTHRTPRHKLNPVSLTAARKNWPHDDKANGKGEGVRVKEGRRMGAEWEDYAAGRTGVGCRIRPAAAEAMGRRITEISFPG